MSKYTLPTSYHSATKLLDHLREYIAETSLTQVKEKLELIILYHQDIGTLYLNILDHSEKLQHKIKSLKDRANKLVESEDVNFLSKYIQLYEANVEPIFAYIAAKEDGVTEPMLTQLFSKTYNLSNEQIKVIRDLVEKTNKGGGV